MASSSGADSATPGTIDSVAVLGCGTMGSGIATVCAAAGCSVLMLDMTAEAAEKGAAAVPEEHRHLISTGTFDADLDKIADHDWICEAIVEDVDIKRSLFERVEAARADGSIVTSNTSGILLSEITEGFDDRLRGDAAITHFFNPVTVMKLLELVPGEQTRPEVIATLTDFCANRLGKGVVNAKDTVNFIGNRIGCYFLLSGLHKAKPFLADGMTQETVDAVLGQPVGVPPTGLYGLLDLIGLDVMDLVGKNMAANLAEGDWGRDCAAFPSVEQAMLDRGQLGRKSGGGFYRVTKNEDGSKDRETFDLVAADWRPTTEPDLSGVPAGLGEVLFTHSDHGRLAWDVFGGTLRYAAGLVPEIADDIVNIDRAMRWGFNWARGPFELIDSFGSERFIEKVRAEGGEVDGMLAVLEASGSSTFYRQDGTEALGHDGTWQSVPE